MNRDDAIQNAYRFLADGRPDVDSVNLKIVDSATREESFGWVFFYNDKRFIESGDSRYALSGNEPIVVLRESGQTMHLPWIKEISSPNDMALRLGAIRKNRDINERIKQFASDIGNN